MVDLTRDQRRRVRARLLDLVPGRTGAGYADWLTARGEDFRKGVKIAALDPFQGYKSAIDDHLEDAVAVLDAFPQVRPGARLAVHEGPYMGTLAFAFWSGLPHLTARSP